MMVRGWTVVDVFGRRWRLWSATPAEPAANGPAAAWDAWVALGTLVHGSFATCPDPRDRVAATLFEIHNAITGERVSHHEWLRADLGTARRMSSSVSESLEWAVRSRHLGIAPDIQRIDRPPSIEDDAPDASRQPVVPEALQDAAGLTFIEIELRDADDETVSNARYVVVGPGSERREGTTDRNGRAREAGLAPGMCTVSFPEIHGPEWAKR